MATLRSVPRSTKAASLRGVLMVDTVRGVLRVRKWPRKYGKPRSALQAWWIDWFKQANKLAQYADGMTQARAIAMTKGSGLYPRDVMLKAMRGRLYVWADETGWKWYPMAAIQDISDSLDVLAQTVGSLLVRATDRWRSVVPGNVNDVLHYKGDTAPPEWLPVATGAGVEQRELPATPIVPDGTANSYDLDVTSYATLAITLDGIGFASGAFTQIQFSTDGGVTFHAGGADYFNTKLTAGADSNVQQAYWTFAASAGTTNHICQMNVTNLRAGRAMFLGIVTRSSADAMHRSGIVNFDGPITDVRIKSDTGANFNAGAIRITGLVAA